MLKAIPAGMLVQDQVDEIRAFVFACAQLDLSHYHSWYRNTRIKILQMCTTYAFVRIEIERYVYNTLIFTILKFVLTYKIMERALRKRVASRGRRLSRFLRVVAKGPRGPEDSTNSHLSIDCP